MSIPNIITSLRIILIPIIVIVFYLPVSWGNVAAASIFIIAALSDWLDGYLARKWDQHTAFGAFFDPVADKLIVAIVLVMLVDEYASIWLTLSAMVIIGREVVISALREWMAEIGKRTSVAVSYVGKLKTTLQMIAIIILLFGELGSPTAQLGLFCMFIAAALTLWSMFIYLKAAWPDLSNEM
jgi:CDP-diacylglycerol--glycerol-3-phosphate 3-phosphatidyltransferase